MERTAPRWYRLLLRPQRVVRLIAIAHFHTLTAARSKDDEERANKGARGKWSRSSAIAVRAGDLNDDDANADGEAKNEDLKYYEHRLLAQQHSRTMGLEYWLEMVDRKHRYGTNLLKYHKVWSKSDASENFFYWLDEGDGKDEDLEECSRKKLESEQLDYLSREEREQYLLEIGDDGLLRWAKAGEKVTTHGPNKDDADDGDDDIQGIDGTTETTNHFTDDLHNARGILQGAGHAVPGPLATMIEKNQNKASWIFVVDTSLHIYAGIKASGTFQHSSFLKGSRVLSAGLISIQDGQLMSLSPHSGHYRPTAENFWITAKCLEAAGVDMSQASILGSWGMLKGAETYRDGLTYLKENAGVNA